MSLLLIIQVWVVTVQHFQKGLIVMGQCPSTMTWLVLSSLNFLKYRKFASSNMSRLETLHGFFRLLMMGIFEFYVRQPFDKKLTTKTR